jgi:protein TonB
VDDRVGDVLAQRAALNGGAGAGVALSLLLHGGLSALAIWAALHQPVVQTPRTIELRLAPVAPARAGAPTAKPAEPVAKMEKPAPPVVETKKPLAPPEKNTVPLSPFGKSNKKGSENATPSVATPPPAQPAPGISTAAAVPVGGAGVIGLEGGDFPYTLYIERMRTLIGAHWHPQIAGPTTTVHFVIERDGRIRDAAVTNGSGNGTFDRDALRAVLESSPLPPLPFGYTGTYLGVHLNLR